MPDVVETDRHHNVPRSMGGSDDCCNIARIPLSRHRDYHRLYGHPLPDQFLRRLFLLHANENTSPDVASGVLGTIRLPQEEMYDPKAFNALQPTFEPPEQHLLYRKASHTIQTCRECIQQAREDVQEIFSTRMNPSDMVVRTRLLRQRLSDSQEKIDRYSQLLPTISRPDSSEASPRVNHRTVAIHRAFHLASELQSTLQTLQDIIARQSSPGRRRHQILSAKHFGQPRNAGPNTILRQALTKRNAQQDRLLYCNPLLPSFRGALLETVGGPETLLSPSLTQREVGLRIRDLAKPLVHHVTQLLHDLHDRQDEVYRADAA